MMLDITHNQYSGIEPHFPLLAQLLTTSSGERYVVETRVQNLADPNDYLLFEPSRYITILYMAHHVADSSCGAPLYSWASNLEGRARYLHARILLVIGSDTASRGLFLMAKKHNVAKKEELNLLLHRLDELN